MSVTTWPIDRIKVGERVRQDLGDLDSLVESIEANGPLIQPILIRSDGTLIAGERRLAACKRLRRDQIEVNIRNDLNSATAVLIAERDENTCRKDFTPSEMVAMGRKLEELERPKAEARERAGVRIEPSGKFPEGSKGETRDKVGAAIGMGGRTYSKAKKVVEAAEAGDPDGIEAVEEMDRTGKVEAAYRKVTQQPLPPRKEFTVDSERHRQIAEKNKIRMEKAVGRCAGINSGFPHLKVSEATALATDEEIRGWIGVFDEAIRSIRQLKKQLEDIR